MTRLTLSIAAVALASVLTSTAAAQTTTSPIQPTATAPEPLPPEPEAFNVTPFIGLGMAGDLENTPGAFGAALGYGVDSRWSVEGELAFTPGGEQGELLEFDTSIWTLSGNLLYHFNADDFTPYATVGVGLMGADAEAESTGLIADDTATEFAWNWGAGIKTSMNQNWGFRGDLRFFNGDELAPDHWRLYGGVVIRRIGQ